MPRENRSGIDWSDPAARREYKRAWEERRPAPGTSARGRPRGSGASTVSIRQRKQRGRLSGYFLYVGRSVYQRIGEPLVIELAWSGSYVLIRSCDAASPQAHRVQTGDDSIPRFTVSEDELSSFDLSVGTHTVTAVGGVIRIGQVERERVLYGSQSRRGSPKVQRNREIVERAAAGEKHQDIAESFGIARTTVVKIVNRWKDKI